MKYADIPAYIATKIDPDDPEPSGAFELKNSVDFRPTVSDVTGTSTTITAVDEVTGNSFNHTNRTFTGTGSVVVDTPQPGAAMSNDFVEEDFQPIDSFEVCGGVEEVSR